MPRNYRRLLDRNFSSRGGVRPTRIVLHTTEGTGTCLGLREFFNREGVQASSHLGIDQAGDSCRMVRDSDKAWTQAYYNPSSLSIEQVGYAATGTRDWIRNHHDQLCKVAKWLAKWSRTHGIPLKHSTSNGVCQHVDLGSLGGGHHDCGPGYPERYVLHWARYWKHRKAGNRVRARLNKRRVLRRQRRAGVKNPTIGWR